METAVAVAAGRRRAVNPGAGLWRRSGPVAAAPGDIPGQQYGKSWFTERGRVGGWFRGTEWGGGFEPKGLNGRRRGGRRSELQGNDGAETTMFFFDLVNIRFALLPGGIPHTYILSIHSHIYFLETATTAGTLSL